MRPPSAPPSALYPALAREPAFDDELVECFQHELPALGAAQELGASSQKVTALGDELPTVRNSRTSERPIMRRRPTHWTAGFATARPASRSTWKLGIAAAALVAIAALAAPAATRGAPPPGSAVVLVSGFNTTTPFTSSDPSCAGREGATWSAPTGPAAALKRAGYTVFTAPAARAGGSPGAPCAGGGPAPPASATIDSNNGGLDANGRALLRFLAFLRSGYGLTRVQLVGHSDGGMWSRAAITQLPGSGAGVTVPVPDDARLAAHWLLRRRPRRVRRRWPL
jgi:hypothetical protein